MKSTIKIYSLFDTPEGENSPTGEHIYKWEYFDENGKIQTDEKNVFEQIQSYVSRVDYKAQILKGELELNGDFNGNNTDTTGLPANTIDIYNYLVNLASLSKEQIANIMEQTHTTNQDSIQTEQTTNSETIDGGQNVK
jgi:hypothetical protein